jgi:hypothetical protein
MTSADARDQEIQQLYYTQGWSAIEIGAEYGLSRSRVHRIVAAGPPHEDLDDEGEAVMLGGDCYEPVPPFTYCATETVITRLPGDDHPTAQEVERWTDVNGWSCSVLDLYRAVQHPAGEGRYEEADAIQAQIDAERQRWRLAVRSLKARYS